MIIVMSSFSDSNFVKKLTELNNTQQSIQTLSLWLIHHRKHSKTITQVWHRELQKVRPSKKLTFLYLANDVIQNSKKKTPEFAKDFGSVLPDAYAVAGRDADEKSKSSMERLLGIWQERGVFKEPFVTQLRENLGSTGNRKKKHRTEKPAPDVEPEKKKKKKEPERTTSLLEELEVIVPEISVPTPDAEDLVKKLSDLQESASCDAAVREKIAALPPEVSDIAHLPKVQDKESAGKLSRQVDDACLLLSEYNKRLSMELEERKDVAKMLRSFILSQKGQVTEAEKKLQEYKSKLANVKTVRHELKSHIQNLPDLTLLELPDVQGGLAPLPSAGDLFSMDQM